MSIPDQFQALTIEETFEHLGASSQGLSSKETKKRLELYGKNVIEEEKISKLRILLRQFNNILIYILFTASIISVSIGELVDFLVINSIILINGLIGFWQELKAEASIAALKKLTESRNKVIRDGALTLISSSELVPGDYLIFHEGEMVTSDVRLVESTGLMVDESPMTGESAPIIKDHTLLLPETALPHELKNMLLAGTAIVRGAGHGVVVKTGSNTYLAKIAEKAKEASPDTPLTKALSFFAKRGVILLIGLFSSLGIIGYLQGRSLLDLAYILLASLVSAVPEGLPIVITLVMVIGALSLSKKQALIRYLPSVETLGSATVIASDKTGTITEGKLIVKEIHSHDLEKLKTIAALCNDSHEGSGDPLDVALSDWVEDYDEMRKKCPRKWTHSFDTRLMLMATVNTINGGEELLVKGAYEVLKEKVENKEELKETEIAFKSFLEQGLRVLAFGSGKWENEDPSSWRIKIVGLIGFLDPPKKGVAEAVVFAKKGGIRVLMITGDHPMTAKAVAKEVGIWTENDKILTGKEIETLSDDLLLEAIKHTTVFARILPEHKYRIVKLLQGCGEIVAVTGDGVNDVPALKAADIGIAMGGGTEAAKSASKMVISDNNLKIITDAIRNARVIADNIRKVIYYLVSTSMQEIILISLAIFSSLPLPLAAIQILWINIVTDGVQDKTFPFAKAEGDVMSRKPRRPEKQFFDFKQIIRILFFGVSLGLISFFLYIYLLDKYSFTTVSTIIFTSVVLAQWANGIQAQKEAEPFFKNIINSLTINPLIFLGVGLSIVLQCAAIYLVPTLFHVTAMSLEHWKYPAFSFLAAFGLVEMRKWVELFISRTFMTKSERTT
jgi:Ca2+-transporting ATPase